MVNQKLLQPQEIEVLYILPAIRRELAKDMKKQGMEQKKIAKLLGVTEAAISQYIKSKRASKVKFGKEPLKLIKSAANKITDKRSMLREVQTLLKEMRKEGITCKVHKELANLPNECIACSDSEKADVEIRK